MSTPTWHQKRPSGSTVDPVAQKLKARMLELGTNPFAVAKEANVHYPVLYRFIVGKGSYRVCELVKVLAVLRMDVLPID